MSNRKEFSPYTLNDFPWRRQCASSWLGSFDFGLALKTGPHREKRTSSSHGMHKVMASFLRSGAASRRELTRTRRGARGWRRTVATGGTLSTTKRSQRKTRELKQGKVADSVPERHPTGHKYSRNPGSLAV